MFTRMAHPSRFGSGHARRVRCAAAVLLTAALTAVLCARSLAAQDLRGTVRDSVSGQPIPGAVFMLLDSSGAVLVRRITDENGRYAIVLTPTTRRARLVRIGFRPREISLPQTSGGTAALDVTMTAVSTMLATVRVRDESRCSHRSDRAAALGLWEQAREGLLATVVARETNTAFIRRLGFVRNFDGASNRVTTFMVREDSATGAVKSFNASHSAADFVQRGFVFDSAGVESLFGPDADVLLDDAFASGYCFRIADPADARPTQVGIAFEPVGYVRNRVDIEGTLWLDTAARALRDIEYRYLGLPGRTDAYHPGGRISFLEMHNGSVMIDRWVIRGVDSENDAPWGDPRRDSRFILHVTETGGELESARWPDGRTWHDALGTFQVSATTRTGAPAVHTLLALSDSPYAATTDSLGNAVIANLLPGPYSFVIVDRQVASLGISIPTSVKFIAERYSVVRAAVEVLSAADWVAGECVRVRQWEVGDSVFVLGRVLTTQGAPVRDAEVSFSVEAGPGLWSRIKNFFTTGSDGVFQSCNEQYALGAPVKITVRRSGMKPLEVIQPLTTKLTTIIVRVPPNP
jgi:hypothetical protein